MSTYESGAEYPSGNVPDQPYDRPLMAAPQRRYGRMITGLLTAAAVSVGSYTALNETDNLPWSADNTTAPSPSQDDHNSAVQVPPDIELAPLTVENGINFSLLREQFGPLPPRVKSQQSNVVMTRAYAGSTQNGQLLAYGGTGVILQSGDILSASHNFAGEFDSRLGTEKSGSLSLDCDNIEIGIASGNKNIQPVHADITRAYVSPDPTDGADIALLTPTTKNGNTGAPVATKRPVKGSRAYIYTNQPDTRNTVHDPKSDDPTQREPGIIAGVNLGPLPNQPDYDLILTGIGALQGENNVVGVGGSGGPLLNQQGEIVGITSRGRVASANTMEFLFGIQPNIQGNDANGSTLYNFTLAQRVDRNIIEETRDMLSANPGC